MADQAVASSRERSAAGHHPVCIGVSDTSLPLLKPMQLLPVKEVFTGPVIGSSG